MDLLAPESAMAFTLSCMHLKHLFGTHHFLELNSKGTIAELLAVDLQDYITCHACRRLHDMKDLQKYKSVTYGSCSRIWYRYAGLPFPFCVSQDKKNNTFYISCWFGTTACEMAIKRHHQRQECKELLQMISSKTAIIRVDGEYVRQSREECRVVRGNLIHQLQIACALRDASQKPTFMHDPPREMICLHATSRRSLQNIGFG
jgi:hypothetical protein